MNKNDLDKTSSFTDIMSKSQLKRHNQSKNFDQIEKDLEKTSSFKKVKKKKNNNNSFIIFVLIVIFLCSTLYLGYNYFYNKDNPNLYYTLFNCASISILSFLCILCITIKKSIFSLLLKILTCILLLGVISINTLTKLDIIKFPERVIVENFVNKNVTSAMNWSKKNNIDLNIQYDYSDVISKNKVISQNIDPNTLISKVKKLNVVVSNGINYDLKVDVPDMTGWKIDEVINKIDELKLNNVNINYEFNEDIKKDILYEQSEHGNMTRNNELKLNFSLGNEKDLKPVKLKDLTNLTVFKSTLWLKRNGIKYEIVYDYSDTIKYDRVIKTEPVKGTIIKQSEDKVKLIVSKGKKILVPDLSKMTLDEIVKWANKNGLNITYDSEYDDTIKKGKVKRANVKKGDTLDQNKAIYVILSKGKLKMINYNENSLDKIKKFADTNHIPIEITENYSDTIASGKIISVSHKVNQIIRNTDTIKIIVSKGKATKIPDFVGLDLSEAKNLCDKNNLKCYYEYAYSDENKGKVLYQNKNSGLEVMEGSSVTLTISNGPAPNGESNYIPPTSNSSNKSNNNSNSNSGNNSSNQPSKPDKPTCTPVTYTLSRDLNNIFSSYSGYSNVASQLYSYFSINYPNVKISVVPNAESGKASGAYVGGIGPGSVVTSCGQTYTIEIAA